jgi:hypothetical protein
LPLADWEWKEVFPSWPDAPLDGETIAALLDAPLPRSLSAKNRDPVVERIEQEASVAQLVEALRLAQSEDAQRILGYMLAHHDRGAEAAAALPVLARNLQEIPGEVRRHAARAIALLVSRLGPQAALEVAPGLGATLRATLEHTTDALLQNELRHALGALGLHTARDPFVEKARLELGFLEQEHGFGPPVAEATAYSVTVRYRNETVAVEASYEFRECWVDVWVVKLQDGVLPSYGSGRRIRPTGTVPAVAQSELAAEAQALRRSPQLLRGEF